MASTDVFVTYNKINTRTEYNWPANFMDGLVHRKERRYWDVNIVRLHCVKIASVITCDSWYILIIINCGNITSFDTHCLETHNF